MWFNSMIREEPYPGLKVSDGLGNRSSLRGAKLGAAWLSSARAVRCRVAKLFGAAANAISNPPGEYVRKNETQRN